MAREYPTVLDLVGGTPLVRLQRVGSDLGADAPRQARVHEPGRQREGPDRPPDDRGCRARGEAPARRDDRGADERQHRRRPGHRGGDQGLPVRLRHAGQDRRGEARAPPRRTAPRSSSARRSSRPNHPRATTRCRTASPRRSPAPSSPTSTRTRRTRRRTTRRPARRSGSRPAASSTPSSSPSGPGGTISGTARYLREQKPDLLVVGADPEGSIFSQPDNVHPVPRRGNRRGLLADHLRPLARRRVRDRLRRRLLPDGSAAGP